MQVNLISTSTKPTTYAIDAWSANQKKKTGVEMYAFQLIQAMKKHALQANERVVLYSPVALEGTLAELPSGWEFRVLPWKLPFGWMRGRVSWELFLHPLDLLFVPSQGLPIVFPPHFARGESEGGLKIVTTIHDLGFLRRPDLYDPASRRRIARVTKRSIRIASQLMTVSEFSKQEIMDVYHIDPNRITVTPLAAETSIYRRLSREDVESILQRHRLGKHFFLYVGRLDKKKNVETLVRAFDQFKTNRGVGDPFELVLVGASGFGFDFIKSLIEASPHKEHIHVLGYLEDTEVAALMNIATAFLFPSWYEGFGIPNLEAMCSGCPLIVSDIPVHREILGDAALFIAPENPERWAEAMKHMVEDSVLRENLVQKGSLRSEQFSWQKTAEKTWEVLRNVVE